MDHIINKKENNLICFPKGSEWRKWDLHIHVPGDKLNDGYKLENEDIWEKFLKKIEESDVEVLGITDYFSKERYDFFMEKFYRKYPKSTKKFFLNIELRLNEAVNKEVEEINIHLIFNPASVSFVQEFLNALKINKTDKNEKQIKCSELKEKKDYEAATVTRKSVEEAFVESFGRKAKQIDHFLIFTPANNDGVRPERGKKRKEAIVDEIDKFSNGFFGGEQNTNHFLNIHRLEDKQQVIAKKPVISGSDSHSFEDIDNFLGKRFKKINKEGVEVIEKDVTWIKADPTYEGLKQLLFEPEPGERVYIGPNKPDIKNPYQIISKIIFKKCKDFQETIEFNQNLCSIIGSRSAGKTALLAYLAHSVDKELTEKLTSGPGEGTEYDWKNINFNYAIEWANNLDNENSKGRVIYIPQNHLYEKSKNSEEVKLRIEPILFKYIPDFKNEYLRILSEIKNINQKIEEYVEDSFSLLDEIIALEQESKNLGDKSSIEKAKLETDTQILKLEEQYKLTNEETVKYQDVKSTLTANKDKIDLYTKDLLAFSRLTDDLSYFTEIKWTLTPNIKNVPESLRVELENEISKAGAVNLTNINLITNKFWLLLREKKDKLLKVNSNMEIENKIIIEKYEKNEEFDSLVKKNNDYTAKIITLIDLEARISSKKKELNETSSNIKKGIDERLSKLNDLKNSLSTKDQTKIEEIKFNLEFELDKELVETISKKINLRENTIFVSNDEMSIERIRNAPSDFIFKIYKGEQKLNKGCDKKVVAKEVLTLTELILFAAEMEGDRIGGFSETTMTPGKRALFLLKLILAESDDKWPLLIDQPEDNLDCRSIFDEIVPFLKKKKKQRQIIMISHNANLVIGADSEQIIVANRHGKDRPNTNEIQFNYLSGSIESTKEKNDQCKDTLESQGIKEHACEILDGGKIAFENRRNKYNLLEP